MHLLPYSCNEFIEPCLCTECTLHEDELVVLSIMKGTEVLTLGAGRLLYACDTL